MKRSRRSNRRYTRSRALPSANSGSASRLAERAGASPRAAVEQLESRQLLFSLTITPDLVDPNTGVGTIRATFGYAIPLFANIVDDFQPNPPTVDIEDFSDDTPLGNILGGGGNINSGRFFTQSNWQLLHDITPGSNIRLAAFPDQQGVPQGQTAQIIAQMSQGQSITLRRAAQANSTQAFLMMRSLSIDFNAAPGTSTGLNLDNTVVELLQIIRQGPTTTTTVVSSFTGAALGALNTTGVPGSGIGTFLFSSTDPNIAAFNGIRIRAINGPNEAFTMDNLTGVFQPGNYVGSVGKRLFGAEISFTGPAFSSFRVLDSYLREMALTTAVGSPGGSANFVVIDPDDNGVPNFNDGIGRITISGADERSSITVIGGTIDENGYTRVDALIGIFDDFEQGGFGFALDANGRVVGLPPGPGSVIIGNPFLRNPTNTGTYGPVNSVFGNPDFTNTDFGVFVVDGSDMGSVYISGVALGTSRFNGFLDRWYSGYQLGSVVVRGDLGTFAVGGDAGAWEVDPGQPIPGVNNQPQSSGGQLTVSRTLGQAIIGGRNFMGITVAGTTNQPSANHPRDTFRYYEIEQPFEIPTGAQNPEAAWINRMYANNAAYVQNKLRASGNAVGLTGQAPIIGETVWRNDHILQAEWVGNVGTAVQVYGNLGGGDATLNTNNDPFDVYGFASDGEQEIVVEVEAVIRGAGTQVPITGRILDHNGRTVAAFEFDDRVRRLALPNASLPQTSQVMRYKPAAPGTYYVVLWDGRTTGDAQTVNEDYVMTIGGMASTAFGSLKVGAQLGDDTPGPTNPAITVLGGSMGAVRVGTGLTASDGSEDDAISSFNDDITDVDQHSEWKGSTVSVTGNLYGAIAGGDIEGATGAPSSALVVVSGDLAELATGLSPVIGVGRGEGDIGGLDLRIGRRIGVLDIKGAIGIDQDSAAPDTTPIGPTLIRSGINGGDGSIGMIRVGEHVAAGLLSVTTGPNSTIGTFLVSQDALGDTGAFSGIYSLAFGSGFGMNFTTGFGSDVRFVDVGRIDQPNSLNARIPIIGGQVVTVVDDAGGRVTIQVTGAAGGVVAGFVRVLPIDGSQGVAIAGIDANLAGGRALVITGDNQTVNQDTISIGRISITGGDAGSAVRLLGSVEIDVWQISQTGTDGAFGVISNETPGGDIVAIDVASLTTLTILTGDLGRTALPSFGPRQIGPFIGIAQAGGDDTATFGIGVGMPDNWNGEMYRSTTDTNADGGNAYLDDIGSPIDPYLNGLRVRTGNVTDVLVGGAIVDVLVQAGDINQVTASFRRVSAPGQFYGILGNVYASGDIVAINVGDGLPAPDSSPLATTSVIAGDDILSFIAAGGASVSSIVTAFNSADTGTAPQEGIVNFSVTGGGDISGAVISAEQFEGFWTSMLGWSSDNRNATGNIFSLLGVDANLYRSDVYAANIVTVLLTNGFYDATFMNATFEIGSITATGFRNSTLQGTTQEFAPNAILGGRSVNTITAGTVGGTGAAAGGDMQDLRIDLLGSLGALTAANISRVVLDVDNTITGITVSNDIRASRVITGELVTLAAAHNIRSSRFDISGPLTAFTAGDEVYNTQINVTGPDGRIDLITARTFFSGTVAASGPIQTISVTQGDMDALITTTTDRGDVALLTASRDLNIRTDISGDVQSLVAGRHIGQIGAFRTILVHGNLAGVDVSGGQLYSDLRIGQSLTGTVTIGAAFNKPGASNLGHGSVISFGAINTVRVLGDFGGKVVSYSGGINLVSINDGSLLTEGVVAAYDGDLRNLVINRGNLLGTVHADYILWAINVNASDDGVFGDIGVNPNSSAGVSYDDHRNQLPPGVIANTPVQGATITAGKNIGRITTSNGSIFETSIYAGRAIGTITVNGDIRNDTLTGGMGTQIIAGSSMFRIIVNGNLHNAGIAAGVLDLGADGMLGGTGSAADTNNLGKVGTVQVSGNSSNTFITAGLTAGGDGVYNTPDDGIVPGLSFVRNVLISGAIANVSVYSDWPVQNVPPGVTLGGSNAPPMDPRIAGGAPAGGVQLSGGGASATFSTASGEAFTVAFQAGGAGARAYWDAAGNRIVLINTSAASTLSVSATPPGGQPKQLTDFRVVTNDDATVGSIAIDANLLGDSWVVVDNNLGSLQFNNAAGGMDVLIGGSMRDFTTGSFAEGTIHARWMRTVNIVGSLGTSAPLDDAFLSALAAGTITVGGDLQGNISLDRDVATVHVGGAMRRATFRSGSNAGSLTFGSVTESRISVRDALGSVGVAGNVFDSSIMAGGDLGADGNPGGAGFNRDDATTGSIGTVTVGGSFIESDIVAGMLRGPDGFFGTSDDSVAAGRSTIGAVTITGQAFGSNFNSEQYRISATGTIAGVTVQGVPPPTGGNFLVRDLATAPLAIQVVRLSTGSDDRIFNAKIEFNQAMDASTIGPALRISEVRDSGNTLIPLTFGTDFFVAYNAVTSTAVITFSNAIMFRNQPQAPGVAAAGIFRFELDQDILRAQVAQSRLDGDGSGQADAGDDYSQDAVVGDAGDKIVPEVAVGIDGGRVDFYGPVDMDVILDNNRNPDGIPDANRVFRIEGALGDHPDNDAGTFPFAGDADVYKITLRAGQILHLGGQQGTALFATRSLLNADGDFQSGETADSLLLPSDVEDLTDISSDANWLIKTTGTYYLVVDNTAGIAPFLPGVVPNISPAGGNIGEYAFDFMIFDDGDTGFAGDTNSGNGTPLATAPTSLAFAGPDQMFGTSDDVTQVRVADFVFTLDRGGDGVAGTTDDVVSGVNGKGIHVARTDGNKITTRIESAIGTPGHVGVPGDVIMPDVDVFHLNNGEPIGAGTKFTVKVKLSERGADLGSRTQQFLVDFNGAVEMGIFETNNATNIDNADLVFGPSDFRSSGGTPGTQLAKNGPLEYGYDENGDFFMTFITPGRLGVGGPASYALYMQGVFNTDYVVEIVQQGTASVTRTHQNIFLETRGGTLDWLLTGDQSTDVLPFRAAALGFTGSLPNGKTVTQYILDNVVASLRSIFDAAGVDVRVSLSPATFEFQDYSTIFLTSSNDPIHSFNERNYGASSHSDPFNADHNDQAAVFVPSFATLGLTASPADLDLFIKSLTATTGRRAGELLGLRMTERQFGGVPRDIMAVNSPEDQPTGSNSYRFTDVSTNLAGPWDYPRTDENVVFSGGGQTQFFLGHQRSRSLLDAFLAP